MYLPLMRIWEEKQKTMKESLFYNAILLCKTNKNTVGLTIFLEKQLFQEGGDLIHGR